MMFRTIVFAVALLSGGAAMADTQAAAPVVVKDIAKFLDHQRDIRDELGTRKFRHIRASSRRDLIEAQDRVFALLAGKRSIGQLSHDEQIALYNDQALIAGILADAELDRPICKREKRIGTNRSETVCTTKRHLEEHKHEVDRLLKGPRNCGGPDCLSTRE